MFQNLISFWKGQDFLTRVMKEFEKMLLDAEKMYTHVREVLVKGNTNEDVCDEIYGVDKEINQMERDIRKRIMEHLSLQPSTDLPVCLILMSVVKDAERLGDYAKNLYEVSQLLYEPLDRELFQEYFGQIDKSVISLIAKTRSAFVEENQELVREISVLEREIVNDCEAAIKRLAKGELSSNLSVCFTLIARYYKRTAAHLFNIGTSVTRPIAELDFEEDKVGKEKNLKTKK